MGLRPWHRLHHASTASPSPYAAVPSAGHTSSSPTQFKTEGAHAHHRRGIRISSSKVMLHTKTVLSKQAKRLAKKADEHEQLITKVTYSLGVLGFGCFCFILGARPHDIPLLYAAFFLVAVPLRWVYYRAKKWHYFLLDFCYYANVICTFYLLFFSKNEKLFLLCFAFSEGPLAWALIVWRCSLVFSSLDKIVSVLIHLLPGTVIFIIRWWDPITFSAHPNPAVDGMFGPWPAWPQVESPANLWLWMFAVPLAVYCVWQLLYFAVVHGLRHQRILSDPEVLTSFRELARKASRANNVWWRISGVLGDDRRFIMYALLQAVFTVLTMALTVPMFRSYRLHAAFQLFKIMTSVWNGGNFFFDVMPRQMHAKANARKQLREQQGAGNAISPSASSEDLRCGKARSPQAKAAPFPGVATQQETEAPTGVPTEADLQIPGSIPRASTVGEGTVAVSRESIAVSSLALEGTAAGQREGRPCHACGYCEGALLRGRSGVRGAGGDAEEGECFLPASSEPLVVEGMSSWEDEGCGRESAEGLRRRAVSQQPQQQGGEVSSSGLEKERMWQGTGGTVACMG